MKNRIQLLKLRIVYLKMGSINSELLASKNWSTKTLVYVSTLSKPRDLHGMIWEVNACPSECLLSQHNQ